MLYEAITTMFPGARVNVDFRLRDDSDGNGPYIEHWDEAAIGSPLPKLDDLQSAFSGIGQPQPEDLVAAEIANDRLLSALTKVLADRFGETPDRLIDAIKAAAR